MIVITAATPWEADPLKARFQLYPRGLNAFQGILKKRPMVLLQTGIGPRKTEDALAALGDITGPLTAISSGLAGALQPGIDSGDLVADVREAPSEWVEAVRNAAGNIRAPIHFGAVRSVDRVLASPAEKMSLGTQERAVAVDMESGAVREWCRERGGTFLCLRAVLDAVHHRLPSEMYDGGRSAGELARYVLRNAKDIPLFAVLGIRQSRAMSRLTNFLDHFLREI